MKIIPAIDIMDHQVVQLVGGVPGTEKIKMPDPLSAAQSWVDKGAKYLHVVDLDAAFDEDDNLDTIKQIARSVNVPIEVGGGIRKESRIRALLDAGVPSLSAAAMLHAGGTIIDELPHGSFFHATAGAVGMGVKERLKVIPYGALVGVTATVASVVVYLLGF